MKILITGGTGFIGKHTVKLLSKSNYLIKLLIRKSSDTSSLKYSNITFVEGDLNNRSSLLEGMEGCDSVINLAAHYTFWESDNNIYGKVNIEGTRNFMECALESGIKKIVHISTAGIYGKPKDDPFNEESPVGPIQYSEYFRTKFEAEKLYGIYLRKRIASCCNISCLCFGFRRYKGQREIHSRSN